MIPSIPSIPGLPFMGTKGNSGISVPLGYKGIKIKDMDYSIVNVGNQTPVIKD